jgi:alcohol dehydrogenase
MGKYDPNIVDNISFDYQARTRLVFGNGKLNEIGDIAKTLSAGRALIVTDPGLMQTGHPDRACNLLRAAGIESEIFKDVIENPTTDCVKKCRDAAVDLGADLLVGIGGGSAMDTAKGANFLITNGGQMKDYWGFGKAEKPMLPVIAIPTTAGTGSECQSFALISDATTHMKMACGDFKAAPRVALLDPELTMTLPFSVTAHTGVDAIAHAVESAVSKKRNPFSMMYAQRAFQIAVHSLKQALDEPENLDARGRMLLGAAYAGMAIENSMLGAAHSMANPLTAHFDVIHGIAVGIMLPHVVRFNSENPDARAIYAELVNVAALKGRNDDHSHSVDILIDKLFELLETAQIPSSLASHGVDGNMIPVMADEAYNQWTRLFNPRDIAADEFETLYRQALKA